MSKEAVFTMKLEPELRDAFMAEAEAADRPASQIVREMMREFVRKQQEERDYDAFYRRKVEKALRSVKAGRGRADDEVRAESAHRLEALRAANGGKLV
ncbi:antitoxin of toxin-antitoxin stability system [Corticibacterium sp. UT-5YL-CI-8]|nr:antitoxin of toxin-antitoxin stability system [Tianweitania sp. UT-5YL-CI-8]